MVSPKTRRTMKKIQLWIDMKSIVYSTVVRKDALENSGKMCRRVTRFV